MVSFELCSLSSFNGWTSSVYFKNKIDFMVSHPMATSANTDVHFVYHVDFEIPRFWYQTTLFLIYNHFRVTYVQVSLLIEPNEITFLCGLKTYYL